MSRSYRAKKARAARAQKMATAIAESMTHRNIASCLDAVFFTASVKKRGTPYPAKVTLIKGKSKVTMPYIQAKKTGFEAVFADVQKMANDAYASKWQSKASVTGNGCISKDNC